MHQSRRSQLPFSIMQNINDSVSKGKYDRFNHILHFKIYIYIYIYIYMADSFHGMSDTKLRC